MSGRLIRCFCGQMFDPEQHQACPACGRPAGMPSPPPAAPRPPPAAPGSGPGPAAGPPPRQTAQIRRPSQGIPPWLWKSAGAAVAVLALVFIATRFPTDDTFDGRHQAGVDRAGASTTRESAGTKGGCAAIEGDWSWFTGGFVHFAADGRAFFKPTQDAPPAITATWTCDPANRSYTLAWSHGFTDTVKLYDGDQVIQGTNHTGVEVSGRRYVDPASGMPPLQTVAAGSQQVPSNLPLLADAAYRVAGNWRPDAYLVSLRIRKDGWPNKEAFYVELSFYSPSEGTGMWISSHRTATRVREAGTVNWGTRRLPERFVDLPQALQNARKAGLRGLISRAELRVDRDDTAVWDITPELHGQAVGLIDASSGELLSRR